MEHIGCYSRNVHTASCLSDMLHVWQKVCHNHRGGAKRVRNNWGPKTCSNKTVSSNNISLCFAFVQRWNSLIPWTVSQCFSKFPRFQVDYVNPIFKWGVTSNFSLENNFKRRRENPVFITNSWGYKHDIFHPRCLSCCTSLQRMRSKIQILWLWSPTVFNIETVLNCPCLDYTFHNHCS